MHLASMKWGYANIVVRHQYKLAGLKDKFLPLKVDFPNQLALALY